MHESAPQKTSWWASPKPWYDLAPALLLSVAVALVIRIPIIISADFPINDGGLWYVLTKILLQHNFVLPDYIDFGGAHLPLCYPPLTAYLLALLCKISSLDVTYFLLLLPTLFNLFAVAAFTVFCYSIFDQKKQAALAALLFPSIFQSYHWFIMGGGVARSLGFLFQILSWIYFVRGVRTSGSLKNIIIAGLLGGLGALFHPAGALWSGLGAFSYALHLWLQRREVKIKELAIMAVLMALVMLPWLASNLARYGFEPFRNAFFSGNQNWLSLTGLILPVHDYKLHSVVAVLAPVGLLVSLASRFYFPALLGIFGTIADTRSAYNGAGVTYSAILSAMTIYTLIESLPKIRALLPEPSSPSKAGSGLSERTWFRIVIGFIVVAQMISYITSTYDPANFLKPLAPEMLQSIKGLESQLPKASKLLLLHQQEPIGSDAVGEWISSLTGLFVVNTHQGMEWIGKFGKVLGGASLRIVDGCSSGNLQRLLLQLAGYGFKYDYFLIERSTCSALELAFKQEPKARELFRDTNFVVYQLDQPGNP